MREATVAPSAGTRPKSRREAAEAGAPPDKSVVLRSDISISDVAASFQRAVVLALVDKTAKAAKQYGATEVFITGGVSANQALRQQMRAQTDLVVRVPPLNLCTDNAAMIAAAAYFRYQSGLRSDLDLDVRPMWALTSTAYQEG